MKSKEEAVLVLFFNEPSKHWHFEELLKEAKISRKQLVRWLKIFNKDDLIIRVKEKGKMPYYRGNYDNPEYQNKKKVYAYDTLYKTGFLNHLINLPKAKTIIIFGSFCRWDWHKESDIDLFVFGDPDDLELYKYESLLGREIQLFSCKDTADLKKYSEALIRNIIKGNFIKGNLNFLRVNINY
ncbi:nucleotidyltransferase domain-containing protein [Candidatus Woesearchaeota archaeon]|nr:nucleotidyltransferase domain-containing protein [Candidatus Woesearchaeota archaeon]